MIVRSVRFKDSVYISHAAEYSIPNGRFTRERAEIHYDTDLPNMIRIHDKELDRWICVPMNNVVQFDLLEEDQTLGKPKKARRKKVTRAKKDASVVSDELS
jgi:hypothetical protein